MDEHVGKQCFGLISKTSVISIITDLSYVTSDLFLVATFILNLLLNVANIMWVLMGCVNDVVMT